MQRLIVTFTPTITVSFTRDDWDLYENASPEIVQALNETLEILVNGGGARDQVYGAMFGLMLKYGDYGAMDSEPLRHLERVLDLIYKK